MSADVTNDAWSNLRRLTPARLALGRAGSALPTSEVLAFALAHARARDAVHVPLDTAALEQACRAWGFDTIHVRSAARDRATYLHRPDLGRKLNQNDAVSLLRRGGPFDLAIVVADGLSGPAVQTNAPPMLEALKPYLDASKLCVAPVVIAEQARVALGDEIGASLRARMSVVLIGERPGLSSSDSLGIYLTLAPRMGCTDAGRNCISNIRPAGLDCQTAARRLFWLIEEAFRVGKSGVDLKDASDLRLAAPNLLPIVTAK
ncbi:MAG: ethanolamine ammonia-lyase subunit EutC [Rhizomicrobium sp.]|jgi:ethanolamine ammonia-lyase small subunit